MLSDLEFEEWNRAIRALDRYENGDDARAFMRLMDDVKDKIDERVIRTLLWTFCNDDDYGVQEHVFTILECADFGLYVKCLAEMFPEIQRRGGGQEWPLIILGSIVNSADASSINVMLEAARNAGNKADVYSMYNFVRSDEFIDEYCEIIPYLKSNT